MLVSKKLGETLKDYQFVYKVDDKTIYATKASMPFQADDDVDTYTLYAKEYIDMPTGRWLSTFTLFQEEA